MSSVPFILETLRAQGLILLWVRRDEKSVLLNQVPSSLSWTAAQHIWVQNHIETATEADVRVTLTSAREEQAGLKCRKRILLPLSFLLLLFSKCLTLYPGFWSQCPTSGHRRAGGSLRPAPTLWAEEWHRPLAGITDAHSVALPLWRTSPTSITKHWCPWQLRSPHSSTAEITLPFHISKPKMICSSP